MDAKERVAYLKETLEKYYRAREFLENEKLNIQNRIDDLEEELQARLGTNV